MDDKQIERARYEERSRRSLEAQATRSDPLGSAALAPILRAPYLAYERAIRLLVRVEHRVLEIGSGDGIHTESLVATGARVTATDIAGAALLSARAHPGLSHQPRLTLSVADMEALPFCDGCFDVVVTAGSLSYGDPVTVDTEIRRVLRKGGSFICVDSLNHNLLYRANRWLRFRRGDRTASTLERMPDHRRIEAIGEAFDTIDIEYFGGFTWAMPPVARAIGDERAARLSDALDRWFRVSRAAFKFVLVAQGRK